MLTFGRRFLWLTYLPPRSLSGEFAGERFGLGRHRLGEDEIVLLGGFLGLLDVLLDVVISLLPLVVQRLERHAIERRLGAVDRGLDILGGAAGVGRLRRA